jgi:hypothetical protein
MRTPTTVLIALVGTALLAAAAAPAQDAEPGTKKAPELRPAGDEGPGGKWPGVAGPATRIDRLHLTEAGGLAFGILVEARRFTGTRVGFAGVTPLEVEAFRILHRDPGAREAFLALGTRGTPAGRVWGLCGLWYWDEDQFDRQLASLLRDHGDTEIETMRGCVVSKRRIREILRAPAGAKAVRLENRSQTHAEWSKKNPEGSAAALDVVGGGWPYVLRSIGVE